jgi:hypothetical protein
MGYAVYTGSSLPPSIRSSSARGPHETRRPMMLHVSSICRPVVKRGSPALLLDVALLLFIPVCGCYRSGSIDRDSDVREVEQGPEDSIIEEEGDPDVLTDHAEDGDAGPDGAICTSNSDCPAGEFCELPPAACAGAGKCLLRPALPCGDLRDPVCGCDWVTYDNDCERKIAGAPQRSAGECPEAPCPDLDFCFGDGWCWESPVPPFVWIEGLWGSSPNEVWAVMEGGYIAHFDGSGLRVFPSGTQEDLHAVWGYAADDVWAVGDAGTLLHWDGSHWSPATALTDADLYGIGCHDATGAWIVGSAGTILHLDEGGWSDVTGVTDADLYDVWGTSADDAWAVGGGGTIIHWDGEDWSSEPIGLTTNDIRGVWASSPDDVWAVGDRGTILHKDRTGWALVADPLPLAGDFTDVWGTNWNDVWLVESEQRFEAAIVHWDGAAFTQAGEAALQCLWGFASNDVWAGGYEEMLRWDGIWWSSVMERTNVTHDDIGRIFGFSERDVWMAGEYFEWIDLGSLKGLLHWDGTTWSRALEPESMLLLDVWGVSSYDLWAVGSDGAIFHYDGDDWITVPSGTFLNLYGIWGASWNDAWAVGSQGTVLHWNGSVWSDVPIEGIPFLTEVWGLSSDDVWAFCDYGSSFHWDGSDWSYVSQVAAMSNPITGAWGASSDDVWAVGFSGIYHWDGRTWSEEHYEDDSGCGAFDVLGFAANDVWAVGAEVCGLIETVYTWGIKILHWDGSAWSRIEVPHAYDPRAPVIHPSLRGIWGTSPDNLWVTGDSGIVLRRCK